MSRRERWLLGLLLVLGLFVRWRILQHWTFVGSDSYGYVKLADQLREHGRYALGPTDPLHFGRLPGYPLFIALVKGAAPAEMSGGNGWERITLAQGLFDALVALPLVFLIARRLAGNRAGLVALALAALCPFTVLFIAAALTEAPATTMTVVTMAVVLLGAERPRRWFPVAGACVALSTFLRPDGILLATGFVPVILAVRSQHQWRERVILAALALAGFAVVYAPWPIRNLVRFHHPYFVGTRVDRYTRPLPNYEGYWSWLKTWGRDNANQTSGATCFYNPPCAPELHAYPPEAFDSDADRAEVQRLFALRAREGISPSVSAGFQSLADRMVARHFWRVRAALPLSRAFHMWVDPNEEVLQRRDLPWPAVTSRLRGVLHPLSAILFLSMLAAAIALVARERTRAPALVLVVPILVRSIVLPYTLYSMPRYINEVMPLALVLIGAAGTEAVRSLQRGVGWAGRRDSGEAQR